LRGQEADLGPEKCDVRVAGAIAAIASLKIGLQIAGEERENFAGGFGAEVGQALDADGRSDFAKSLARGGDEVTEQLAANESLHAIGPIVGRVIPPLSRTQ
jgi:hypothetical protein